MVEQLTPKLLLREKIEMDKSDDHQQLLLKHNVLVTQTSQFQLTLLQLL